MPPTGVTTAIPPEAKAQLVGARRAFPIAAAQLWNSLRMDVHLAPSLVTCKNGTILVGFYLTSLLLIPDSFIELGFKILQFYDHVVFLMVYAGCLGLI